ncbi:hypothetical protein PENTCL1PPCAC_14686 [Pristionchus entomophagus]|uniref:Copper transport protein n=1 Tax=Pristionchus entomophagus TaxID=358040 RepID=A0AAV5TGR8_9BILA|nr:hypothetical protein PENTCL1PPCAC_14686 [Pristionchus entomophagus]
MDHLTMGSMSGPMSFHFGSEETVLFDFWKFSSVWGLIVTCLILAAFSIVKEWARMARAACSKSTENNRSIVARVVDMALHAVVLILSYFLMVIFMNLNVWMSLTIIVSEVLCHAISSHFSSRSNVNRFEK